MNDTNINVHVFVNDGQQCLLERYFFPSLQDSFSVIQHRVPHPAHSNYLSAEYMEILLFRAETLLGEILPAEKERRFFIMSDIDIQFFAKCFNTVRKAIEARDMVFLAETGLPDTRVNCGFIAMRSNHRVHAFWAELLVRFKASLKSGGSLHDQDIANSLLRDGVDLHWGIFPDRFWAWSNRNINAFKTREIGSIVMHHANLVLPNKRQSGLRMKMAQLDYVKRARAGKIIPWVDRWRFGRDVGGGIKLLERLGAGLGRLWAKFG